MRKEANRGGLPPAPAAGGDIDTLAKDIERMIDHVQRYKEAVPMMRTMLDAFDLVRSHLPPDAELSEYDRRAVAAVERCRLRMQEWMDKDKDKDNKT